MSPKVAMTGDECVAVCSVLRYGRELQTIATDFPKVQSDKQKKLYINIVNILLTEVFVKSIHNKIVWKYGS